MGNLKEIRTRITSVMSTQQITKAMKLVAASKLRRAQDAIIQMRPYAHKLQDILNNLSDSLDENTGNQYYEVREPQNILIIPVSSDKGLCGSFNGNIAKTTLRLIEEKYPSQFANGTVDLLCVGKKVREHFQKRNFPVNDKSRDFFSNLEFSEVDELISAVMKAFEEKKYDRIEVVYNRFKNAAIYFTEADQFLPVREEVMEEENTGKKEMVNDYIFEPGKKEILEDLIPRSLKVNFFRMILDSNAAEHGSRMTAMDQATENAQDLLFDLRLKYNKERQAAITKEILEIVGGAEALGQG